MDPSGGPPALKGLNLHGILASAAAVAAVLTCVVGCTEYACLPKARLRFQIRPFNLPPARHRARIAAAMALSKLSGDEQRILFTQLCNVLEPRLAVALSSTCNELRTATQALLPQLRADHEVAAALCFKMGLRSCKELREAKEVNWHSKGLSAADLALLGTLGSVLPALEVLELYEPAAGPDGVQRLAEGLGAGALPAVTSLAIGGMHMGDAGASVLAAALGRGALPRLKFLELDNAAIGDAGLVALAPALRRLPALEDLGLEDNPFGDEGLAAFVAPPPPAGAQPTTTAGLAKLKELNLHSTQITDAGCATLAAAFYSGALPALESINLHGSPASAAGQAAVHEALEKSRSTVRS
eukprot:scaffold14840_cov66-Phaeocystis_antarctica.AAC.6